MDKLGHRHLDIELGGGGAARWVERFGDLELEALDDRRLRLRYGGVEDKGGELEVDRLLRSLVEGGATIRSVEGGRSSLEEIFRTVLEEDTRRNGAGGER